MSESFVISVNGRKVRVAEGASVAAAMMMANEHQHMGDAGYMGDMHSVALGDHSMDHILPLVEFPYGFPSPGRYRIFIQMKHSEIVETGIFDATVQ